MLGRQLKKAVLCQQGRRGQATARLDFGIPHSRARGLGRQETHSATDLQGVLDTRSRTQSVPVVQMRTAVTLGILLLGARIGLA